MKIDFPEDFVLKCFSLHQRDSTFLQNKNTHIGMLKSGGKASSQGSSLSLDGSRNVGTFGKKIVFSVILFSTKSSGNLQNHFLAFPCIVLWKVTTPVI